MIYAILALGAMAASCQKSDLAPTPKPVPGDNDTPVTVSLTTAPLEILPMSGASQAPGTKTTTSSGSMTVQYSTPKNSTKSKPSLTTEQEQKVNDLWVIQFDKASGALVGQPYYATSEQIRTNPSTGKLEFEARLTTASTAQIVYFVANTNSPSTFNRDNCKNIGALQLLCRSLRDEYKPAAGLPMFAAQEYLSIAAGTPLSGATLRRLVAKVVFRYKVAPDFAGFTVTSVQLKNVAATIPYAFSKSGYVDFPAKDDTYGAGSHFDYPQEEPTAAVADGDFQTFTWYAPENLRIPTTTVSNDRDRVLANTDGKATYVEIRGSFKNPAKCEQITYQIMLGNGDLNNYNIRDNFIYTVEVTLEGRSTADKRVTAESFDMNNSAMVVPNSGNKGAVTFDIRKLTRGWQTTMPALGDDADLRAELLWTDNAALASQLNIGLDKVNGLLTVKSTGAAEGNAVVALYDSKTAGSGEILWSWHIWVTDYQPAQAGFVTRTPNTAYPVNGGQVHTYGTEFQKANGNDKVIMDRNLGATAALYVVAHWTTATLPDADIYGAWGLHYQWGRKDPFPKAEFRGNLTVPTASIYDKANNAITYDASMVTVGTATMEAAIKDPLRFYSNGSGRWDWNQTPDGTLWGDGTTKSVYDPCPKGWRVPPAETWGDFNTSNIEKPVWSGFSNRAGFLYSGADVKAWYPAAGSRSLSSGEIANAGGNGGYWTRQGDETSGKAYVMTFNYPDFNPNVFLQRMLGNSVRCVQE